MSGRIDPDLPILDELELEFHRLLGRTFDHAGRRHAGRSRPPATPASRTRGADRPPIGRVARRVMTALALLSLAGATALAGRSVVGSEGGSTGDSPVTIGEGAPGWRLLAHRDGGRVCGTFVISKTVTSGCGDDLAPSGVQAASTADAGRRFVFGLAGADVARVLVRVGGRRIEVPTRAAANRRELAGAGLPAGMRWFVAATPRTTATERPAWIAPRAESGRPLGRPVLDCSLGAATPACRRATAR